MRTGATKGLVDPFPFIVDGIHGDVPVNMYPASDSDKGVIVLPSPGLRELCRLPNCSEVRGLYAWDGYLWAVARRGTSSVLWKVSTAGTCTEMGVFTTSHTGPVWMANNNSQLVVVDGVTGYVYEATGGFAPIQDANFPGAAACAYQDGYGLFVRPDSSIWFFSKMWDFKTYDPLDFYAKQSKPDKLVTIMSFKRQPWLFGETSTEVWYNAGGDNTSPLNPTFALDTGGRIEKGCAAAASPSDLCGEAPVWLADDRQLVMAVGYSVRTVSNQMFARATAQMPKVSDAIGFSYQLLGHTFYQITFPSGDQTWVWDLTTGTLHKRVSWKSGGGWGRHRANCLARLEGRLWVGDYENGKIYEMTPDCYDDDGHEILRVLHTVEVDGGLRRIFFSRVQLIVESGVGTSTKDPQICLQFSGDGGRTWSPEFWRGAGKMGEYRRRAIWNQVGSGFRRIYRFTMTDPVLWRILGVSIGGGDAST